VNLIVHCPELEVGQYNSRFQRLINLSGRVSGFCGLILKVYGTITTCKEATLLRIEVMTFFFNFFFSNISVIPNSVVIPGREGW
jgi:hypothetical protein